ncbi:hypothetical protein LX32DRAFT_636082 [Colletotrichum zoysiae]|uniref:Uncharacterized protein n=1 Tax=Colletotrichum zoysiae TaxID=1216348 RepID=A0AAD9M5P8_9PEZI|nr:hypothetical protein LX32DRAFT_636082 [Colletotrichum zoysiae]
MIGLCCWMERLGGESGSAALCLGRFTEQLRGQHSSKPRDESRDFESCALRRGLGGECQITGFAGVHVFGVIKLVISRGRG